MTPRQVQTLEAIKTLTRELGRSPSYREIGERIESTTSAVHGMVKALMREGHVKRTPGRHHSIVVVGSPETDRGSEPASAPPVTWDSYLCCRDHDRGPGAWAVRGKHLENLIVPSRALGEAIAHLLNGAPGPASAQATRWLEVEDGWAALQAVERLNN